MKRTNKPKSLVSQVEEHSTKDVETPPELDGNTEMITSTGSTLLNLAISGERTRKGGIPAGILVEVFGPSSTGKTVLLCEIAGYIQRNGGQVMFMDPEARLNKRFAKLFDFKPEEAIYSTPDTVPEMFKPVRRWEPEGTSPHGIFGDSLAALSTKMEMEDEDKMGMRRAKEFSEECRKACRTIKNNNFLMVCSNQVRVNVGAGPYAPKYITPGGEAIPFYSSLRLRTSLKRKIKVEKKIYGKDIKRVEGIEIQVEVFKSTVGIPYRTAPVYIIFDYGIDNIRANLQFLKQMTGSKKYMIGDKELTVSMPRSIEVVEDRGWERRLERAVIDTWRDIESKFKTDRKPKRR